MTNTILSHPDEKSSPFDRKGQIFNYALILKFFVNKIARFNNIIIAFTPFILNPTICITYSINSLSIFTIPSLYEVNYLLMKSHCTLLLTHTYIIISQTFTLIFSYFLGYYCELTKLWLGFTLPQDCHNISPTLIKSNIRNNCFQTTYRPYK